MRRLTSWVSIGIEPSPGNAVSIQSICPRLLSSEAIYAHHQYSIDRVRTLVLGWLSHIRTDDVDDEELNSRLLRAVEQLGSPTQATTFRRRKRMAAQRLYTRPQKTKRIS